MAAQDNSRGLHPGQFAPMGGKLRLRLCKRIAHVRGGCTPGNSRLWVLVPSGDRPGPTEPAGETLASLVLIGPSAHVRGPVLGLSIRALRRQATLAPVRTTSARPRRSASAVKSRPWQLAVARAHQETSARPRGVAPRAIRAHGSSLPLVLFKRLAHVRGPVPGLSIRAHGSSLRSCSSRD